MESISAIIFDCDGVLVDSERIYQAVEREFLAEIGLVFDLEDYQHRFMGLKSADYIRALEAESIKHGRGALPEDFASQLRGECRKRLMRDLEGMDGIETVLENFGGPRAVASSSALHLLHDKLHKTGLHHYFDPHIYSGENVERGKPHPDLFLHAASELDAAPEACLVVEDAVNGVRAGKAAGMRVWGFVGGGHASSGLEAQLRGAGADRVFSSHTDIHAALNSLPIDDETL